MVENSSKIGELSTTSALLSYCCSRVKGFRISTASSSLLNFDTDYWLQCGYSPRRCYIMQR